MTCQEIDNLLHPYVDGEFDAAERLEVDSHLARCPACTQKVQAERQFRDALRLKALAHDAPHTRAPEALRQRVIAGIRAEQRRDRIRRVAYAASAAVVAAAVSTAGWAWWPKNRERFLEDAAKRHSRPLPAEIVADAHDEVEAWFGGKLDHRVPVPRFPNAQVAGARILNVQDRPAAHIRYQKPDERGTPRTISLFVFGDEENEVEAQPLHQAEFDKRLGYNMAIWRDGEIVYELVSDLDEQDIRALLQAQLEGGNPQPKDLSPRAPAGITAPPLRPEIPVSPASIRQ